LKHQARKRFGQNFLHDATIIDAIVRAVNPKPEQSLLEIGPGLGALTQPLLQHVSQLTAIELDRDLIQHLQQLPMANRLTVISADALQMDLAQLNLTLPVRIIGNLPYNISSPLLFHLLAQRTVIQDMHFMLQKEVVDRIAAEPGSRTYGRLSVMFQYYCETEPLLEVPPEAFTPAPKVQSAIIRLTPKHSDRDEPVVFERLQRVVQTAFAMRRKTLRNNFRQLLPAEVMESIELDWSARPETLSVAQFVALTRSCDEYLS